MNIRMKALGSALAAAAVMAFAAGSASATNDMGTLNPDGSVAGSIVIDYNPAAGTITYAFGADAPTTITGDTNGGVAIAFDFEVVGSALTLVQADAENPVSVNDTFGGAPFIYLYDDTTAATVTGPYSFVYDATFRTYDAVTNPITLQPGDYTEFVDGTLAPGVTDINVGAFAAAAVPEPATWAVMFLGFGGIGAAMRIARRRQRVATA